MQPIIFQSNYCQSDQGEIHFFVLYLIVLYFTFEGLIQFTLPKHHPKVVDGAGVKLDSEHYISGRVPKALVVALQLQKK